MGFKPLTYKNAPGEEPHITPEDDAAIYESIVGTDGAFTVGEQFKATVISNNKVRIGNGVLNVGGHMGRTTYGDYVDVTIENGVSEQNRNDLIIARFVIGDTDTYELDVKKGVSGKEAVDPELIQEDLYNGGKTREYPLYRVKIEGLSIVKVEQMLEIRPTIPMLNKYLSDKENPVIMEKIVKTPGITLNAFEGKALSSSAITPPTVEGYRCIGLASGWGEGQVGLVVSPNGWVANCTNVKKTYNAVTLKFLYLKTF